MRTPQIDTDNCDVVLWREGMEIYWMHVSTVTIHKVGDNDLASLIMRFPESTRLCIEDDQTGKVVQILPVAH